MALTVTLGEGGRILLSGRFDASQADRVQEFLDAHARGPQTLDCAGLQYISSAGLGVLLRAQKRLMGSGARLRIVNVNRHIREVFRFSGFDSLFEIEAAPES